MSSPLRTPVYPVNASQSFIGTMPGSAVKQALGKTQPSHSINLDMSKVLNDKVINTNRTTMSVVETRKY